MNIFASEPVEASELSSFLDEIFSKFDRGKVADDEFDFAEIWEADEDFREEVKMIAREIIEESISKNSTRQEQNMYFREALVEYFEYRVLYLEFFEIKSDEDQKAVCSFLWEYDFNESTLEEAVDDTLYNYQAHEALYCILKELLMKFFNEWHERDYPKKHMGLLKVYYRVGIRSIIDEKDGEESPLLELLEILKDSSEREKKLFVEKRSLLQALSLIEDFRELCTNSN